MTNNQLIVIPNFISVEECGVLNDWVDNSISNNQFNMGRKFGIGWIDEKRLNTRNSYNTIVYPNLAYDILSRISNRLGILENCRSTINLGKDGIVVSCTLPGGEVLPHQDPMEGPRLHLLRCNIMSRDSDKGGQLYIDEKKIEINVGDLHCYLPSALTHYVTTVEGNTSRVMWMFGYKMSIPDFLKLRNQNLIKII